MCGVDKARDRLSRASPALAAASAMVLQSPETRASMPVRTFLEIRLGSPSPAGGAGLSRARSARLAGDTVTFFMSATVGACR